MILSILIPTTVDRRPMFNTLLEEFLHQHVPGVQILYEEDNKEISVGRKRQILLDRAEGDYVVSFDSDDWPYPSYTADILTALESKPDCVGFLIHMTTNGKRPRTCCHSLKYKLWAERVDGYDYVRNVTHFNPVRRDLALKVGFPDLRFGEDKWYSDRVTKLCKKEVFINKKLFHYRPTTTMSHNERYGIKNR
jgi:glycosyltransferase involved in cell wall biosynthesis